MSYDALIAHARQTQALAEVAGRLGWDQETVMPRGAAGQRAEEMAAMEQVLHARRSDPQLGDWLAAVTPADEVEAAQVREIRRAFDRATRVPTDLAARIARVTSLAQGDWAAARAADDFAAFAPRLAEVVALKREEAAALASGGDLYDALLQDYEPGATAADLEAMFGALRPRLVALRDRILGAPQPPALTGTFPEAAQLEMARELAELFGYDLSRGRIDTAVHPFSSGSGADVRITTRTDPADPFNCFYSTIHEVGHATYEQRVDPAYALSPIGRGASMGVHESQSRIYENQLARSPAFAKWLFGRMQAKFGGLGVDTAQEFARTVNRVTPGFIRTESDEVQYNLHVLLRFDLERALIAGDLQVADLEEAWNARFFKDFGVKVPKASLGVLQDVHWSVGLFGYFPTYTLGNVYAGCLYQAMAADLPDLEADLAIGDLTAALAWLRPRLQVHGALRDGAETLRHATGHPPTEGPLLDYLEAKFGALYGL
ncbi:carboxypeptidase M32 [Fluviibacterium sp. DFM31]|uniref:Metal-dependent carboxypeptidase n=1 Tax=Meridianimarinicoccus marinus TaxID=3231483 RepID=A0ABV3L383_9RHOB